MTGRRTAAARVPGVFVLLFAQNRYQAPNAVMWQPARSSSSQQARHQGRRTTLSLVRLTQNPAGRSLQWTQS